MKNALAITLALTSIGTLANCEKLLEQAKRENRPQLVLTFDGLATAELGMKVLEHTFIKEYERECPRRPIMTKTFYYSKSGAKKAVACAQSFKDEFGDRAKLSIVGHSFGAGKGVFNFIEAARKSDLFIENAVTFDPRGYDYKYSAPSKSLVGNFVNIYQKFPLAGRKVKGADYEANVTGRTSHVGLPGKFSDLALAHVKGYLKCR